MRFVAAIRRKIRVIKIYKLRNIVILILQRYGKKNYQNTFIYRIIRFVYHKLMGKGVLLHIKLDITERCNKRCEYCYSKKRDIEPPFNEIMKLFAQIRGRVHRIDLTGGEPMLREDIYKIIEAAKKLGMFVTMFTNGTLINEEEAMRLKKSGLDIAFVSFYSDNHSLQDSISGSSGTFESKISGIKELARAGIKTYTLTVLNKNNVGCIESINKLVRKLGVSPSFFNQIPSTKEDLGSQLSAKDVYKVKALLKKIGPRRMLHVYNMFKFFGRSCFGGYFTVSIKVDGTVTHCPFVYDVILGNAFKENIFEIFKRRFANQEFKNIYEVPQECLSCFFVQYCRGGCKAGNKAVFGDYNKKSFYCLGPWQNVELENMADCIAYWS